MRLLLSTATLLALLGSPIAQAGKGSFEAEQSEIRLNLRRERERAQRVANENARAERAESESVFRHYESLIAERIPGYRIAEYPAAHMRVACIMETPSDHCNVPAFVRVASSEDSSIAATLYSCRSVCPAYVKRESKPYEEYAPWDMLGAFPKVRYRQVETRIDPCDFEPDCYHIEPTKRPAPRKSRGRKR